MKFQILGSVQLRHGGRQLRLGRAKERALLGVLLLNHHKRVTTDTLMHALWDHNPPERAHKDLQAYVSRLRAALRSQGCTAEILTQHHAYVLHADDDQLDLTQFKALRASAEAARRAGRVDEAARHLYEAIELWQGPPLADLHTSWAELVREDLDAYHRLPGYQLLCSVELDRGNYYDALELLDTITSGHELDTRCISLRLSTLNAAGHYAEFDSYWKHIYRRTVEAFGTGPGRELRQLHQQLLFERDALISEHPAVASVPAPLPPPAQLPPTIDDFVGRAEQLSELETLLAQAQLTRQPTTLIIAITGGPGVGKTTTALRWAHGIRDRFPAGQLYADLRGYADTPPRDPGEILGEFLQALAVPVGQIPAGVEARGGLFRSVLAGQNALIVLDDAQDSSQILPLLPGASGCVVLVTSRHRLAPLATRHGARRVALPPLAQAERLDLFRMIFARSRRQRTDPVALSGLADLSAGLPLAVRLLGERPSTWPRCR
ncbi:BTAD domain-containing putative transcriptional regulator [Kutzneria buriramensis]|uniref:DNA-binding SARP family transcriptional activator n=1 Tax=Kutzneria buriramensis TaxID=1045776 RepID=A0A3E0HLK1_9PSEU|nr:BTAD domain-containing putative transcriptional regulator [Kutzneria buriramensis]REH47329.1 DNA-binding SARP family transcriptional activator [Kutzneria buriramensis]